MTKKDMETKTKQYVEKENRVVELHFNGSGAFYKLLSEIDNYATRDNLKKYVKELSFKNYSISVNLKGLTYDFIGNELYITLELYNISAILKVKFQDLLTLYD